MKRLASRKNVQNKKLLVLPSTIELIEDFLNINKIIGERSYDFLVERCGIKAVGLVFQVSVLPIIDKKIEELKDVFDSESFSMSAFRRICKSRDINILSGKPRIKTLKKASGYFSLSSSGEKCIWLKDGLTRKQKLFVAAHEISHFCLHSQYMLKDGNIAAYRSPEVTNKASEVWAEVEADLMATVLLRLGKRREVKQ